MSGFMSISEKMSTRRRNVVTVDGIIAMDLEPIGLVGWVAQQITGGFAGLDRVQADCGESNVVRDQTMWIYRERCIRAGKQCNDEWLIEQAEDGLTEDIFWVDESDLQE